MKSQSTRADLILQATAIETWLDSNAPYARTDQKHLDDRSVEQAYWHLGYATALSDALRLLDLVQHPGSKQLA